MLGELLKVEAGIDILHVPYKGSPPALIDLVSGQVQMMFVEQAVPHVQARSLKALAVMDAGAWPNFLWYRPLRKTAFRNCRRPLGPVSSRRLARRLRWYAGSTPPSTTTSQLQRHARTSRSSEQHH